MPASIPCRALIVVGALIATMPGEEAAGQMLRTQGIISAIRPGFLKVSTDRGDVVLKMNAKKENILMEAEAEPNWLRRGMLVRFEATLDDDGVAIDPLKELTVFTARPGYGLGVLLDKPATAGPPDRTSRRTNRSRRSTRNPTDDDELDDRPDERRNLDDQDGDTDAPNGDTPKEKGDRNDEPTGPVYLVAGRLDQFRNGQLVVVAGRDRVTATLPEDAKIKVDILGDYSLAQPGDAIDFTAKRLKANQAIALRVKIVADAPLQGQRPQTVRDKRRQNRPETPRDRAIDEALN